MKVKYTLIVLAMLSSCVQHFDEKELYGKYVAVNYKNTFDTIQLMPQGSYYRHVYDRNKKLVLETEGKWKLEEQKTKLKFIHFYLNLDDDLIKFPESVKDTSTEVITTLETQKGTVIFCVGYYRGENCYEKIK